MALVNCAASLTPNFSPRSCSRYASQAVAITLDSVQPFCLAIWRMAVLMWRGTRPVTCSVCLVSEPWRVGRSTAFVGAVALPCLFPSAGGYAVVGCSRCAVNRPGGCLSALRHHLGRV